MNMDRHTLSEFMDLLCGRFDNREQFEITPGGGRHLLSPLPGM